MRIEDIKSLSIIGTYEFPLKVECKTCGAEHDHETEISCKVLTYELVLIDERAMTFTRSWKEPVGDFYDWICNTVLTSMKPLENIIKTPSPTMSILKSIKSIEDSDKEQLAMLNNPEIEREDIVKCTNQKLDLDGNVNEDIEVGKEYRVYDIHKANKKVVYYEVFDDTSDSGMKIPILPSEVELVRKRVIQPPKSVIPDMIKKCDMCGEQNAILLKGDHYEGNCEKCGANITAERPVKSNA